MAAISYHIPYMNSGLNNICNVDMMLQICETLIWKKKNNFQNSVPFISIEYTTYLQTGFLMYSSDTAALLQQSELLLCLSVRPKPYF